jgi:hypothetical protein
MLRQLMLRQRALDRLLIPCDVVGVVETYLGLVPGRPPATADAFSKPIGPAAAKDELVAPPLGGNGEVAATGT